MVLHKKLDLSETSITRGQQQVDKLVKVQEKHVHSLHFQMLGFCRRIPHCLNTLLQTKERDRAIARVESVANEAAGLRAKVAIIREKELEIGKLKDHISTHEAKVLRMGFVNFFEEYFLR